MDENTTAAAWQASQAMAGSGRRTLLRAAAAGGLAAAAIWPAGRALAQPSDGVVKIGVLDDMSGVFADQQGMGDVVSARMAVEDWGGRVLGAPVELVYGDLQNRPDVGMGIARRWYDQEKVDAIFGIGNSAVALAVQQLTREKNRINISVAAGTTDLTGRGCSPLGVHWTYDNYALARGTATAMVADGRRRWFFITSDYAFGHSLEQNGTEIVRALGGEVVGSVRAPFPETDFSSHIVRAAQSGAQVVGLAVSGTDLINAVKQMGEFGLMRRGIQPAALLCLLTNV
jgi:branched-chain amino acid transport system substrate-binding protein